MGYGLGVDLGTTFTAAATLTDGTATMVGLGNRALQIPSVLYMRSGEPPLVGEAAERRGLADPAPLVREFKRRFGDPVPIMVGGTPYSAPALTAHLLRWVLLQTTERMGAPPSSVTLTRPANWGEFKLDLLRDVARLADVSNALTCTEPEAAAVEYASRNRVSPGEKIAIYDLGGGTFDICFFVKTADGFQMVGRPDGIEQLGGVDFDEAVFQFVIGNAGLDLDQVDPADPEAISGIRQLRRDCVEAKEALSQDVDTVVPVAIADIRTSVRLTRPDFEALIGPALDDTVRATERGLRSSGLAATDISAFVLVGGSSRIPLVSEVLSRAFRCTVARDTHPKHDIAMGAARVGSMPAMATELLPREGSGGGRPLTVPPVATAGAAAAVAGEIAAAGADVGAGERVGRMSGPDPAAAGAPSGPPPWSAGAAANASGQVWPPPAGQLRQRTHAGVPGESGSRRRVWIIVAAVVAVVAVATVAAVVALSNKGGSGGAAEAPLATGAATGAAATDAAATDAAATGAAATGGTGTGVAASASTLGATAPAQGAASTSAGVSAAGAGSVAQSGAPVSSAPLGVIPVAVAVPGTSAWTNTGVQCVIGSTVDIAATGSVVHNVATDQSVGPDGDTRPELRKYNVKGLPDANHAALIGSIGGTQPFFVIGAGRTLTCPATGPLYLGVNDAGVQNNSGAFVATIRTAG